MALTTPKTLSERLSQLDEIYKEGELADKDLFAEQRSNLLLVMGEHYVSKAQMGMNNIRARADIAPDIKIRLTKNHVQKISKLYVNTIVNEAPGTMFEAANPKELKDKKSAQLREKLWKHAKRTQKFKKKVRAWAEDYVNIGEVAVKVFFDPTKGKLISNEPVLDEEGNDTGKTTPVFSGEFVFERIFGFNLIRHYQSRDWENNPVICIRKMTPVKDLKALAGGDEVKMAAITEDANEEFTVFDAQTGKYSKSKGMAMLREYYFRPCMEYPKGYFIYAVKGAILAEGELPLGKFPIAFAPFEEVQTSPRGRSPIKHMRPFQVEINRKASKMAEHQMSIGDDKIILMNGSKLEQGGVQAGVRVFKATGQEPKVMAGRDGSQYMSGMLQDIEELYSVMGVAEAAQEKQDGVVDPYALIFRSASQKKLFRANVERFEMFLQDVTDIYITLAPHYYPEEMLQKILGADDITNVEMLYDQEDLCYQIEMEAVSDDISSQMGKQLVLSQALQYAAQHMNREDIGKLVSSMPFVDAKDVFSDFTMDSDLADNVVLALDRGKPPMVHDYDNHEYMIKRLTSRVRLPDFETLPLPVQQNYMQAISMHEQGQSIVVARQMALKNAFIPTGGAMIACDMYVKDEFSKNPEATKRVRIPYQALDWLVNALDQQGHSLSSLEAMNPQAANEVAGKAQAAVAQGGPPAPAGPGSPQPVQPIGGQGMPVTPGRA
jgi:hypothetical protein